MDYKRAWPVLKTALRDPYVPPAIRRKMLLISDIMTAVPFWRRRRVWDRLWDFMIVMAMAETEEDSNDVD